MPRIKSGPDLGVTEDLFHLGKGRIEMNGESEIVARGIVRGIVVGESATGGIVRTIGRSAQTRCPRCHADDLALEGPARGIPCGACGVLYHADCLVEGCVSFNCRITGTVVSGAEVEAFELERADWGAWTEAPEGAALEISWRASGLAEGPNPLAEYGGWRYRMWIGGEVYGPNPLAEVARHEWARVSWAEVEARPVSMYRVEVIDSGEVVGAEVEVAEDSEDADEPETLDGGIDYLLLSADRVSDEYRQQLLDGDPDDYVDRQHIEDMAWSAFQSGETIDFAAVWREEVESLMERDTEEMADSLGYQIVLDRHTVVANEALAAVFGGLSIDIVAELR